MAEPVSNDDSLVISTDPLHVSGYLLFDLSALSELTRQSCI